MLRKPILVSLLGAVLALGCEVHESSPTDGGTPDGGLVCPQAVPAEGPGNAPPNAPCDEDGDCLSNSCRDPATNPAEGCTCRNLDRSACATAFDVQSLDFLECEFDEPTGICVFYIDFASDDEVSCGAHCEGLGGTCIGSEDESSQTGPGRCQGSGFTSDCAELFGSAICSCSVPDDG